MASEMKRMRTPARFTLSAFQKLGFFFSRMWEPTLYSSSTVSYTHLAGPLESVEHHLSRSVSDGVDGNGHIVPVGGDHQPVQLCLLLSLIHI